nr:PREDICTED: arylsulfatase B-like isoform X1 [Bemisia tabaci]XP_018908138.1 PREDICTED: arylsulfatase B-like isoform X1 [Bemisia tabaci]
MVSNIWTALICVVFVVTRAAATYNQKRPHIIYILADDLGWNDVGYHGSNAIQTPNIDALAYDGIILDKFYVNPLCTPSRAALMTGKYPIRTGMQHFVLYGAEPRGLPLRERLLPEYLRDLGYVNHLVGKWHLGHYKRKYTPLYRGFHSHLGFWTGRHDFFDHTACENGTWGLDMRREMEPAYDLHGEYTTDVLTRRATALIQRHDPSKPMFMYMSHAAMHSGNPYNPIPVPENLAATMFSNIPDYHRRRYAVALHLLDQSVGAMVEALSERKMLENTIIIFSTDNGGPAAGFNINAASNWPLRGVKSTLWEGGVRGAAFVWSPMLKNPGRVSNQLMDITYWLPTLLSAANRKMDVCPRSDEDEDLDDDPPVTEDDYGYDSNDNNDRRRSLPADSNSRKIRGCSKLDGRDVWDALVNDKPFNTTTILHNIDQIDGNAALRYGKWKYVNGTVFRGIGDAIFGPSERGPENGYNVSLVLSSKTSQILQKMNRGASPEKIRSLRQQSTVVCSSRNGTTCNPNKGPCLFNIDEDPCERNNVAEANPAVLRDLENRLAKFQRTSMPPGNLPLDERGNPEHWNYVWTNFGDYLNLPDDIPPRGEPLLPVTEAVFACSRNGGRVI